MVSVMVSVMVLAVESAAFRQPVGLLELAPAAMNLNGDNPELEVAAVFAVNESLVEAEMLRHGVAVRR